jgi:hypothetical protein
VANIIYLYVKKRLSMRVSNETFGKKREKETRGKNESITLYTALNS